MLNTNKYASGCKANVIFCFTGSLGGIWFPPAQTWASSVSRPYQQIWSIIFVRHISKYGILISSLAYWTLPWAYSKALAACPSAISNVCLCRSTERAVLAAQPLFQWTPCHLCVIRCSLCFSHCVQLRQWRSFWQLDTESSCNHFVKQKAIDFRTLSQLSLRVLVCILHLNFPHLFLALALWFLRHSRQHGVLWKHHKLNAHTMSCLLLCLGKNVGYLNT